MHEEAEDYHLTQIQHAFEFEAMLKLTEALLLLLLLLLLLCCDVELAREEVEDVDLAEDVDFEDY